MFLDGFRTTAVCLLLLAGVGVANDAAAAARRLSVRLRTAHYAVWGSGAAGEVGAVAEAAEDLYREFLETFDERLPLKEPRIPLLIVASLSPVSAADLSAGRMICEVGVAPLKPAEFIVFRVIHQTGAAAGPRPSRASAGTRRPRSRGR